MFVSLCVMLVFGDLVGNSFFELIFFMIYRMVGCEIREIII